MVDKKKASEERLDKVIADARRAAEDREKGYRAQALKLYPWICGRCSREFTRKNLNELTVHHRDHNHDNNPSDGSNWELLCLFCHDNEHSRLLEAGNDMGNAAQSNAATQNPFAALKSLMDKKDT
ncbi:Uncharacterized protein YajD [hydrothermal vent metagenome]|uniref:Uncharacterized protein YajD n=1 Tax=hydrothermal vent metagenome TaxID=652676 RepID=A0A3B1AZI2_9ZZZZ